MRLVKLFLGIRMNMLLLAIFFYVPACELAELGIAADAERVFLLAKIPERSASRGKPDRRRRELPE